MCTCMFNYLLGQLGMGTTITRNKTKRNGLFLVFVCKSYYFECLIKELVINSNTFIELASKQSMFLV
jgi:hypothetical protein